MKKGKDLIATLVLYTDGDFGLENKDGYFENSSDYKYTKKILIKNFEKDMMELFKEIKERVFTNNDYFNNFFEKLKPSDFKDNQEELNPWNFEGGDFVYMSGNQEFEIFVDIDDVEILESKEEKENYQKYLELSKLFKNKVIKE